MSGKLSNGSLKDQRPQQAGATTTGCRCPSHKYSFNPKLISSKITKLACLCPDIFRIIELY